MTRSRAARATVAALLLFVAAIAPAQVPPADPAPATPADPAQDVPATPIDLTTRYRFIERYTPKADAVRDGMIGVYQVASQETIETVIELPQAAPERSDLIFLARYSERPAEVGGTDGRRVTKAVRRFESVRSRPDLRIKPTDPQPLDNLVIWMEMRPASPPLIVSLTGGRGLREEAYRFAAFQQTFVPDLTKALPDLPSRVGDTWQLTRDACEALIGGKVATGSLIGKLAEIRKDAESGKSTAVITIAGKVTRATGPSAVNARLLFDFRPTEPAAGPGGARPKAEADDTQAPTVEARGAIVRLALAQVETSAVPRGDQRLKATRTRNLILERRLGEGELPVNLPAAPPQAKPENSWLTYVDPKERFHFRHPQFLLVDPAALVARPEAIEMVRQQPKGPDVVRLAFTPKGETPDSPPPAPDVVFRKRLEAMTQGGAEVTPGTAAWQPEGDWPNMRVYSAEAAVKPGSADGPSRVHFLGYVAQLADGGTVYVEALTAQDSPESFRAQVESLLKTVASGPPSGPI